MFMDLIKLIALLFRNCNSAGVINERLAVVRFLSAGVCVC